MGSYVSASKFLELPFIKKRGSLTSSELLLNDLTDEQIIKTIVESNIDHIQTTKGPTDKELEILNQIFHENYNIAFRHYGEYNKSCDISYLSKLTNLKNLYLDIYCEIRNIDVLKKLNLDGLGFDCFSLKDYSFLKEVSSNIKKLTIDLSDKTYKMDINDILHMKGLKNLAIRNVKKGLDKLVEFQNLEELYLRSVNIKDYSFLNKMNVKKIYLGFQNVEYFNTFGINEKIEEVSLWMNRNLKDLSFLLQFPNLKRIIISGQSKVEIIPNLKKLSKLEEVYFLDKKIDEVKKCCNSNVKVYSWYNPVDIN